MIPTQRNDILKRFGRDVFNKALRIFENGGVLKVERGEKFLTGLVRSENSISIQYAQNIATDRLHIDGTCSCPVGYNCKHVAAVLLYYLSKGAAVSVVSPTKTPNKNQSDQDMSAQMRHWLSTIHGVGDVSSAVPVVEKPYSQLTYVLQPPKDHSDLLLDQLSLVVSRATFNPKKKTFSNMKEIYSIDEILQRGGRNYVTYEDLAVLTALSAAHPSYWTPTIIPIEHPTHLKLTLDRGSAFWKIVSDTTRLRMGEPYKGRLMWRMHANHDQSLFCSPTAEDQHIDHIIMFDRPWYIDTHALKCGPLSAISVPDDMLKKLLSMPHVRPSETLTVEKQLQKAFKSSMKWPSLQQFQVQEDTGDVQIKPVLRLYGEKFSAWRTPSATSFGLAQLLMDYDGQRVHYSQPHTPITIIRDNQCYVVQRQEEVEDRFHKELTSLLPSLQPTEEWGENYRYRIPLKEKQSMALFSSVKSPDDMTIQKEWDHFLSKDVTILEKNGWKIEVDSSFPYIRAIEPDDWFAELFASEDAQSSGIEWFNLELGITIGDERINLLPILSQMIRNSRAFLDEAKKNNQELCVDLPDGRRISLPVDRVQNMLNLLREVYGMHHLRDGALKISAKDVGYLQELEAATKAMSMRWLGGQRLFELARKLHTFEGVQEIPPPEKMKADLRDYQKTGLNWLQFLREYGLGGLLADDMGLGKTVQVLAYLAHEHEQGRLTKPMLVVAPTSVVSNWKAEAAKFVPHIPTLTIHGSDRHENFNLIKDHSLILTTYPLILRDKDHWLNHHFHTIILDEAHAIKNPRTKVSLIANQLKGDTRFCLTGTPIENHLGELWSLFNFIIPGFLETNKNFNEFYKNPIEREQDTTRQTSLVQRVKPFVLRRRKEEVVKELPPKTEIIKLCELHKSQMDLYETIRLSMQTRVQEEILQKGLGKSQIIVLDALLKLRQICCDPRLMNSSTAKKMNESVKLDVLKDMLEELLEEGRRILIFSQFTSMLALIEDELKIMKVDYVKLIGETRDRETPIKAFQAGKVSVFLISLKAGGVGLNLTAADTVIHYDPWWNPAAEDQATDRAHRIGQDKPVFVYKLIAQGTVEEKMLELQQRKRGVAESVLGASGQKASTFTAEDIKNLFSA